MRLLVCLLLLYSCSNEPSVPKGVLTPKKMEAVLYDAVLADEWVGFAGLQDSTFRLFSKSTALYDSILHIHDVTKETFQKSLQFYQQHPDILKDILESLRQKTDTTLVKKPLVKRLTPL